MSIYLDFQNLEETNFSFLSEMNRLVSFYERVYGLLDNEGRSICVAVSGGSDSLSLLFLLSSFSKLYGWKVCCATVDHQLRPESKNEALYVGKICARLGIEHTILTWNHPTLTDKGKLENLAREARYQLLVQFCEKEKVHFVATGHNWNDQLETYELRKMNGSKILGLAGMSQIRSLSTNVKLIRPILNFSKQYLESFLKQQGICWKTDSMNFDENFKRVVVRKRINGYDRKKFEMISERVQALGLKRAEIEHETVGFLKDYVEILNFGYATINFPELLKCIRRVQIEIIRRIIGTIGGKKYLPSISKSMIKKIINGDINTLSRCFMKIKKEKIYVFRENRNIPAVPMRNDKIFWDERFLILPLLNLIKEDNVIFIGSGVGAKNFRKKNAEIPGDALVGFPCLYKNHQVEYEIDRWVEYAKFIHKPDLFDVYCGVNCA